MRRKLGVYLICVLFVMGFIACGGDSDDDTDKQPTQPSTQPPTSDGGGDTVLQIEVDYAAEEAAIIEVFTLYAEGIESEDPDEFMPYWLKSEKDDVFVAWDFWAKAFERHVGWKKVKTGWEGIFRLRSGKMTVEIDSVAINKNAKTAMLLGTYQWAVNGGFIALLGRQNREDEWKIKQVDYTNGLYGKQVDELENPAYVNSPPEAEEE